LFWKYAAYVSGLVSALLILSGTFEQLLVYSGLVLSLFMALTLSTIFRLRRTIAVGSHQYRAPLYPFLPAALVIGAVTMVVYSLVQRPSESLYGAATVLSGIPLYYFWRRQEGVHQHKP
jgi:APA family basic amino acid/polyamine antiporter